MPRSMTGFAEARGEGSGHDWRWELRSVNGRGLDLRLRLPDWIEGLEPAVRQAVGGRASRGSLTLSLRVSRVPGAGPPGRAIDPGALAAALAALAEVDRAAGAAGLALRPASAADLLSMPGVAREAHDEPDAPALRAALLADLAGVLDAWDAARGAEGARLAEAVAARVDRIEALAAEAEGAAAARDAGRADALRRAIARLLEDVPADPDRLAQEAALIAVRTDVAEEIDRLRAHVAAARDLLASAEPAGRRLDFLSQEFAREANTICSKAQSAELAAAGLELKAVIDQMREQVQNVE